MQNPIVTQLTQAITPVVSIGVGSAIWTVCRRQHLNPEALTKEQLPVVKMGLLEHYEKFWSDKIRDLALALDTVKP